MHQPMGNLFFRGATPREIESMGFRSIMYWNKWAELMSKAEADATKKAQGGA